MKKIANFLHSGKTQTNELCFSFNDELKKYKLYHSRRVIHLCKN